MSNKTINKCLQRFYRISTKIKLIIKKVRIELYILELNWKINYPKKTNGLND